MRVTFTKKKSVFLIFTEMYWSFSLRVMSTEKFKRLKKLIYNFGESYDYRKISVIIVLSEMYWWFSVSVMSTDFFVIQIFTAVYLSFSVRVMMTNKCLCLWYSQKSTDNFSWQLSLQKNFFDSSCRNLLIIFCESNVYRKISVILIYTEIEW